MAVLKKSVLGTFVNKVGGVVGSSWKGIPVVRSLPASVANPRSAAQMTQRMRFALMVWFAANILQGWIRPLWNRGAKRMSGYNAFVSANMTAFNLDGNIVTTEILASNGRLLAPSYVASAVDGSDTIFSINHPTNDRYATANDEIYMLIWDRTLQRLFFSGGTGVVRGNTSLSTVTMVLPTPRSFSIWVAYRHPRGIFVSSSKYYTIGSSQETIRPTAEMLFSFAKLMKVDTSNIDSSLDEAEAIAVLKDAIREKCAVRDVTIKSEGLVDVDFSDTDHEYEPISEEIEVEKVSIEEVNQSEGEFRQKPMKHASRNRGRN